MSGADGAGVDLAAFCDGGLDTDAAAAATAAAASSETSDEDFAALLELEGLDCIDFSDLAAFDAPDV